MTIPFIWNKFLGINLLDHMEVNILTLQDYQTGFQSSSKFDTATNHTCELRLLYILAITSYCKAFKF